MTSCSLEYRIILDNEFNKFRSKLPRDREDKILTTTTTKEKTLSDKLNQLARVYIIACMMETKTHFTKCLINENLCSYLSWMKAVPTASSSLCGK